MIVRYEGEGTGLRLEDPSDQWRCLDIGGSTAPTAPMRLYVGEAEGVGATVELGPEDVAHIVAHCGMYLARRIAGWTPRRYSRK